MGSWAGFGFQAWKGVGDTGLGLYAMGGLSGGLGAVATGGNFWKGMGQGMITTGLNHAAWHEVARLNGELPNYSGKYNPTTRRMEGCVFATWKSILQYLGIEKYKDIEIKPQGSDIDDYADEIKQPKSQVAADGKVVASVISQNRPVAMQYIPVGQTDGHAVAISAVYERFGKYKFKIMDPDYGHSRELRLDDAKGAKCLTPSPCVIQ